MNTFEMAHQAGESVARERLCTDIPKLTPADSSHLFLAGMAHAIAMVSPDADNYRFYSEIAEGLIDTYYAELREAAFKDWEESAPTTTPLNMES